MKEKLYIIEQDRNLVSYLYLEEKNNMEPQINKNYNFRKEFCPLLGITNYHATKRKEDLLIWLKNFYDYEFVDCNGLSSYITITEIYGEYKPLPRKHSQVTDLTKQKVKDYEDYVKKALPHDYEPLSYSLVAQNAMEDFSTEKYGHTHKESVIRRYVKPAFNKYGETNDKHVWVWYSSYAPLEEETMREWRTILSEEKIGEKEAANAFYRYANGEDVSKEISYYKKALERFKRIHQDFPINVREWRHNL